MTGWFLDRGNHPGTGIAFITNMDGLINHVEESGVF